MRPRRAFIGLDEIGSIAAREKDAALVCALPRSSFDGVDPVAGRRGHIPGSLNIPAASLLDEEGYFLPVAQFRERLAPLDGISPVAVYCGGGISATVVGFALTLIGREDVEIYDGSLAEWNSDPSCPLSLTV